MSKRPLLAAVSVKSTKNMKFTVITLFPDFIKNMENYSIIGRAIKNKIIDLDIIDLRRFGIGSYKQVDDRPFGGGPGMLMRVDVVVKAIRKAEKTAEKRRKTILLCPTGKIFDQKTACRLSKLDEIILVCGHYEGFDKRIEDYVDEKISIGEFVLSGGELPAMSIIDAISRQISGVLGNFESLNLESFPLRTTDNQRLTTDEPPQYTRPREFENKKVPDALLSGDPKKIRDWQDKSSPCIG